VPKVILFLVKSGFFEKVDAKSKLIILSIWFLLSIVLIKGVCGLSIRVDKEDFDHLFTAVFFQLVETGVKPLLNFFSDSTTSLTVNLISGEKL